MVQRYALDGIAGDKSTRVDTNASHVSTDPDQTRLYQATKMSVSFRVQSAAIFFPRRALVVYYDSRMGYPYF